MNSMTDVGNVDVPGDRAATILTQKVPCLTESKANFSGDGSGTESRSLFSVLVVSEVPRFERTRRTSRMKTDRPMKGLSESSALACFASSSVANSTILQVSLGT